MESHNEDSSNNKQHRFMNPDFIKTNLLISSLFITAYELLKSAIIERIRDFLCHNINFTEKGIEIEESDEYKNKVRKLDKNLLEASLNWLINHRVINDKDKDVIHKIREFRNSIAHRLPELLYNRQELFDINLFLEAKRLLDKIERWWIVEVEIPTNPDFDDLDYDNIIWEEIQPGSSIMLNWVVSCAFDLQKEEK